MFELSKIITRKNETHARVSLVIPIMNKVAYKLHEFIPIPYNEKKETKIIYINSKYFFYYKPNSAHIINQRIKSKNA